MEETGEAKASNHWEFLGRKAAEMGVYSETLENRLAGLDPEQAAGIVNGYADGLTERNPQSAYSFLDADWAKMLIRDRKSKTAAIVKGMALQKPNRAPDAEEDRALTALVLTHLNKDQAELTAIAEAAEEHRPRISAAVYASQNDTTRLAALAEKVFQTDRQLAFDLVPDKGYLKIRQDIALKTLDCDDFSQHDANYVFDNLPCPGLGEDTAQYNKLVALAMEAAPFTALRAAEKLKKERASDAASVELHKKARTNLIKKEAGRGLHEVRHCFVKSEDRYNPHSPSRSTRVDVITDRDGALELALELTESGQIDGKHYSLRGAIELFRMLEYEGQERTEAVRALHLGQRKSQVYGDNKFNFHPSEEVAAGLSLAETSPTEAFYLLLGHVKDHPKARIAMHPLSIALENAGDIANAYSAERKAEQPDNARVDDLRARLARQSDKRCPHEFYWHRDTEGKRLWFAMHGQGMDLGDRYKFAFELSNEIGDESYVTPLRDTVMNAGLNFARHQFHYARDTKGMDMLKQSLLQEQPALAGHADLMTTLLELVAAKKTD